MIIFSGIYQKKTDSANYKRVSGVKNQVYDTKNDCYGYERRDEFRRAELDRFVQADVEGAGRAGIVAGNFELSQLLLIFDSLNTINHNTTMKKNYYLRQEQSSLLRRFPLSFA